MTEILTIYYIILLYWGLHNEEDDDLQVFIQLFVPMICIIIVNIGSFVLKLFI